MEKHSFRIVSGDLPVSGNRFQYFRKIWWNYGIFRSVIIQSIKASLFHVHCWQMVKLVNTARFKKNAWIFVNIMHKRVYKNLWYHWLVDSPQSPQRLIVVEMASKTDAYVLALSLKTFVRMVFSLVVLLRYNNDLNLFLYFFLWEIYRCSYLKW